MKILDKKKTLPEISLEEYLITALPPVDIRVDKTGTHPAVWEAKVFTCMIELHWFANDGKDLGWKVIGGIDARDPFTLVLHDPNQFPIIAETVKAYEALYPGNEVTIVIADAPEI